MEQVKSALVNPISGQKDDGVLEKKATLKSVGLNFLIGLGVFVFIVLSYILIKPLNELFGTTNGAIAKAYGIILIALLAIAYIVVRYFEKNTFEVNVWFLLILMLLLHLTYMLYTKMDTRQHDTWSANSNGHYDYAYSLYLNFRLSDGTNPLTGVLFNESNIYQFYHPPLSYFIQAIWMHVFEVINWNKDILGSGEDYYKNLYGACQILSCYYTFLIGWYMVKTLRLTHLSKKAFYLSVIFCLFFPRLNQLSGQLNNDNLAILFSILCIYRVFKWQKEGHSYKDFLLAGLYLGLGMMSKLSSVIICLGLAVYFLIELIRSIKKKEGSLSLRNIIIQYVCFILICAPLGLWFQVYAHITYSLPYNFVFRSLNSALFTGTRGYVIANSDFYSLSYYDSNNSGLIYTSGIVNFLVRYVIPFYPADFAASAIYCNAFNNYNILTYAIKSSIFGEFSYWGGEGFGLIAVLAAYVIWFFLLVFFVYALIKRKKWLTEQGKLAGLIVLSILFFYLYLQVKMPYGCSMDFRYIVPIILPLGLLFGLVYDSLDKGRKTSSNIMSCILFYGVLFFVGASQLFYLFAI